MFNIGSAGQAGLPTGQAGSQAEVSSRVGGTDITP
jgi:hypothetical protein